MLTTSALPSAVFVVGMLVQPRSSEPKRIWWDECPELFDLNHESWWSHTKLNDLNALIVWEDGGQVRGHVDTREQSNSKWFMGLFSILPPSQFNINTWVFLSLFLRHSKCCFRSFPLDLNHISVGIFSVVAPDTKALLCKDVVSWGTFYHPLSSNNRLKFLAVLILHDLHPSHFLPQFPWLHIQIVVCFCCCCFHHSLRHFKPNMAVNSLLPPQAAPSYVPHLTKWQPAPSRPKPKAWSLHPLLPLTLHIPSVPRPGFSSLHSVLCLPSSSSMRSHL